MNFTLIDEDATVSHVRLEGRLDAAGAAAVDLRFTAALAAHGRPGLVDLSGVPFIASMGMRLLVSVARTLKLKGEMLILYGLQPQVLEVLEDAGMTHLLTVAADEQQARHHLGT